MSGGLELMYTIAHATTTPMQAYHRCDRPDNYLRSQGWVRDDFSLWTHPEHGGPMVLLAAWTAQWVIDKQKEESA